MTGIDVSNPDSPDETRPFQDHGQMEIFGVAGHQVGRGVFEPGWRWSQDVKPIAGTESCQVEHLGFCAEGHMTIKMDDGTEKRIEQGQFFSIPPGHDAWCDDERCVLIDWAGDSGYAKQD